MSELDEGAPIRAGTFKTLSGRDGLPVKYMFGDVWYLRPRAVPLILTNHKPRIPNAADEAVWRRVRVIPFDVKFYAHGTPQRDTHIRSKLSQERVLILAWMLQGWLRHRERPVGEVDEPERVLLEGKKYREQDDHVARWLSDHMVVSDPMPLPGQPGEFHTPAQDVLADYESYCELEGVDQPLSRNRLPNALELRGHHRKRANQGKVWTTMRRKTHIELASGEL